LGYLDYGIIGVYLLFALGTGVYFSKRAAKSPEDYFLGGRSFPWWMIAISMVATSFASDTPLVVTEITRHDGLQRIWWIFVAVLTLIVGIFLFSRLWRRAAVITDAEFYELRYEGKSAAFLRGFRAFFAGIVQNLVTISWVIFAMSSIVTTMTDIDEWLAIGICTSVALVYATFSGFYGVVVTDCVQFFIATFSMIALAVIAVVKVGGMGHVLETIRATEGYGPRTLAIFPEFKSFDEDLAKLLIYLLVLWWIDASGYNMQRMSACRNERDSVRATIFYAIFQCCRPWIWVVVALVSIVLFPTLTDPYNDTHAYPLVMNEYLGYGLKGLLVTAFLAAFMSTVDTHLNWGASYMMTDVYRRFVKPQATQRHYMIVTKLVVVAMMAAGVGIALYLAWQNLTVSAVWEFFALIYGRQWHCQCAALVLVAHQCLYRDHGPGARTDPRMRRPVRPGICHAVGAHVAPQSVRIPLAPDALRVQDRFADRHCRAHQPARDVPDAGGVQGEARRVLQEGPARRRLGNPQQGNP